MAEQHTVIIVTTCFRRSYGLFKAFTSETLKQTRKRVYLHKTPSTTTPIIFVFFNKHTGWLRKKSKVFIIAITVFWCHPTSDQPSVAVLSRSLAGQNPGASSQSEDTFRRQLKTWLFQEFFSGHHHLILLAS